MRFNKLILTAMAATPLMLCAQPKLLGNNAPSFLDRGSAMFCNRNYIGAVDHLNHLIEFTDAEVSDIERAAYIKALSAFELDDPNNLATLQEFIENYPTSVYKPIVLTRIADYHFYRGDYDKALSAYYDVPTRMLDGDNDEDARYRMAYSYLQLGQWDNAAALYRELATTKQYGAASEFYQAYIDYARKDYDSALEKFLAIDRTGELGYQAQYYVAQINFAKGNYNKVIDLGNSLLEDQANDYFAPELHRIIGESYYRGGSIDLAKSHLTEYLNTTEEPVVRSAAYTLGVINYDRHDLTEAAKCMAHVADEDDALAQSANLYLGQCYLEKKEVDKAAMAFEKAARMRYDEKVRETAFYNYAISQSQGGRTPFNNSIDMFEQFLNDYPKSAYKANVEDYLYDAYLTTTDYNRALTSISHIKNPGEKVLKAKQHVLYNLGVQELSNDNNDKAENYFNQAIALGKLDTKVYNECHLWLGEAQYRNGDFKKATANQQAYVASISKSDSNYAIAQYNLGYSLYQQRKYADARKAFQNAINAGNLDKDLMADAYNRLGDTQYYTQNFAAADKAYQQALSADNNAAADYSLFQRARMAGLNKNYSEQISLLDALASQYPNSTLLPAALLEKSNAQAAAGSTADAIATLDNLVSKYPSSAEARYGMLREAIIYRNSGNEAKALDTYRQVVKRYPTSDEAKTAVEDLKIVAAERGELAELSNYLKGIKGAPQLDISEAEKLTFEAAERQIVAEKSKSDKMESYLKNYPAGAYVGKAHYYMGRHYFARRDYDKALKEINIALDMGDDAAYAEDALAIKSEILINQGKSGEAIDVYRTLAEKASSQDNKIIAQMGLMRAAKQAKKWTDVIASTEILLSQGGLSAEEEKEVRLNRAIANNQLGNATEAQADLESLAGDTRNEYGAQAAYQLALMKYNAGNLTGAESQLKKFIDAGTPHHYWLGKAFILLADVYQKQGKTQDAIDYLNSLKDNYPGKEGEIFNEIDTRLAKWTKKKK